MNGELIVEGEVADGHSPSRFGWVAVAEGRIVARGDASTPHERADRVPVVRTRWLLPGLFDMHVHGAQGVDFATVGDDPTPAIEHHRRAGAARLLASLGTGSESDTLTRVRELRPLVSSGQLAGLHLEGPWLSPERRGAHARELLRAPDRRELDALLHAAEGCIRMITLAPEIPGADLAIRTIVDAGVVAAIGHTTADATQTDAALDAGASVITHLFNGMPPLHHRRPGVVGRALTRPDAVVELIADGVHLDDLIVDLVLQTSSARTVFVSDAMAATGLGDGRYRLAGSDVVVAGGVARLEDGSSLAGSTATLGAIAARELLRGTPAEAVASAASTRPAASLGQEARRLAPGEAADLMLIDEDGRRRVMGAGQWLDSSR